MHGGTINFSFSVSVEPRICKRGMDSMLVLCNPKNTAPAVPSTCANVLSFLKDVGDWFSTSFKGGSAVATIGTPTDSCDDQSAISFQTGSHRLYSTKVDTDSIFYIAGRSQMMDDAAAAAHSADSAKPEPAPAPPACP